MVVIFYFKADYKLVMLEIDRLMAKGSKKNSRGELAEIRKLELSAKEYEQAKYVVEPPDSLIGMIEMRMQNLFLNTPDQPDGRGIRLSP